MRDKGSRGSHFAIYPYRGELPAPKHLDVRGVHVERLASAGNIYRVAVHGPNGFLRWFSGRVR